MLDTLNQYILFNIVEYLPWYYYYKINVSSSILKKLSQTENLHKKKLQRCIKHIYSYIQKFSDLRGFNRKGILISRDNLCKNPKRFAGKKIQFVSTFQYNPFQVEAGKISEGNDISLLIENKKMKIKNI